MRLSFLWLSLLSLTLTSCLEETETTVEIGYQGEARLNPFLALEKFYQKEHYDASSILRLDEMPWDGTLLFIPAESVTTRSRAQQLKRWVDDGGHLVYLLHGTGQMGWQKDGGQFKEPDLVDHPLLEAYDIKFGNLTGRTEFASFDFGRQKGRVQFPSSNTFDVTRNNDVDLFMGENTENALMASIDAGYGRFTALASAFPLRNRALAKQDHAAFALALSNLLESEDILFVFASELSFWSMLWNVGWMPLLGLIALLLFWLWKVLPSFGPRLPPEALLQRHFSDHLLMTAQFLWRHSEPTSLLDPVRRRLTKHYQTSTGRSLPDFASTELHGYLAQRSGLPSERIREAMLNNPTKDSNAFTRLIQDLNLLETSL